MVRSGCHHDRAAGRGQRPSGSYAAQSNGSAKSKQLEALRDGYSKAAGAGIAGPRLLPGSLRWSIASAGVLACLSLSAEVSSGDAIRQRYGAIHGRVVTKSHRPVPQAHIQVGAIAPRRDLPQIGYFTRASGFYAIRNLHPGRYLLRIYKNGVFLAQKKVQVYRGRSSPAYFVVRWLRRR